MSQQDATATPRINGINAYWRTNMNIFDEDFNPDAVTSTASVGISKRTPPATAQLCAEALEYKETLINVGVFNLPTETSVTAWRNNEALTGYITAVAECLPPEGTTYRGQLSYQETIVYPFEEASARLHHMVCRENSTAQIAASFPCYIPNTPEAATLKMRIDQFLVKASELGLVTKRTYTNQGSRWILRNLAALITEAREATPFTGFVTTPNALIPDNKSILLVPALISPTGAIIREEFTAPVHDGATLSPLLLIEPNKEQLEMYLADWETENRARVKATLARFSVTSIEYSNATKVKAPSGLRKMRDLPVGGITGRNIVYSDQRGRKAEAGLYSRYQTVKGGIYYKWAEEPTMSIITADMTSAMFMGIVTLYGDKDYAEAFNLTSKVTDPWLDGVGISHLGRPVLSELAGKISLMFPDYDVPALRRAVRELLKYTGTPSGYGSSAYRAGIACSEITGIEAELCSQVATWVQLFPPLLGLRQAISEATNLCSAYSYDFNFQYKEAPALVIAKSLDNTYNHEAIQDNFCPLDWVHAPLLGKARISFLANAVQHWESALLDGCLKLCEWAESEGLTVNDAGELVKKTSNNPTEWLLFHKHDQIGLNNPNNLNWLRGALPIIANAWTAQVRTKFFEHFGVRVPAETFNISLDAQMTKLD